MSAAPCRDGSSFHVFTVGAERCSICGWNRWPEVDDAAPMTAPVAASGRVAGVTGWTGSATWGSRHIGGYTINAWRSDAAGGWHWTVEKGRALIIENVQTLNRKGRETLMDTAIRVRILAETALEAHLAETLAALRGAP